MAQARRVVDPTTDEQGSLRTVVKATTTDEQKSRATVIDSITVQSPRLIDFRKAALLAAYRKHAGNVSRAARAAGVSRDTFYQYRKTDPAFAAAVAEVHEEMIDTVEAGLWALMLTAQSEAVRLSALMYWLRAKARDRGYGRQCPTCASRARGGVRFEKLTPYQPGPDL